MSASGFVYAIESGDAAAMGLIRRGQIAKISTKVMRGSDDVDCSSARRHGALDRGVCVARRRHRVWHQARRVD